ncbi:MAG: type II toxin-antitoxin system RelB/DinJ family antitoxin [Succinivibrio sp.]|jgi:addiction module RelB/DinJ family antitoxin|nr:type II toxin-antitoxin system RelB/DinJ family antitoxin [Succinivibrio sp.]
MAATTISVAIDHDLKEEALKVFGRLHLSMSEAVRIFLRACADRECLPFERRPEYEAQEKKRSGESREPSASYWSKMIQTANEEAEEEKRDCMRRRAYWAAR